MQSAEDSDVSSVLLVLNEDGDILRELTLSDGDVVQFAVRDSVFVHDASGAFDWLVHAPGVLARATIGTGIHEVVAYSSPFAAIRIDRPEKLVFGSTVVAQSAPARITIGVAEVEAASIELTLNCVDLLAAAGASLPGGPFSGSFVLDGTTVQVRDLALDMAAGTLTFTLEDLPGGTHKLDVAGEPVYLDSLPPGWPHWNRPLGVLRHEREISVFRVQI